MHKILSRVPHRTNTACEFKGVIAMFCSMNDSGITFFFFFFYKSQNHKD